jgi:hypothetical protein
MATIVLIIGKSASGKSTSHRNFGKEAGLINVLGKPLPYRTTDENRMGIATTDKIPEIIYLLSRAQTDTVIVDDAGYLMTNRYMRENRTTPDTFKFYADLGTTFWEMITYAKDVMPKYKVVYFIMHEEKNNFGDIAPKTIGKMLDEKVCLEGMFTIVFRSERVNGEYVFHTNTNGSDVAKTPIGMFDTPTVPNDLKAINDIIREFYQLDKIKEEELKKLENNNIKTQGENTNA